MTHAEPPVAKAALLGRCPRCGKGSLFNGYLNVAPACSACGLDYAPFDAGDGPAVFVILIVGALTYFPAYSLGAIVEQLLMLAGKTF